MHEKLRARPGLRTQSTMPPTLSVAEIYRQSLKPKDTLFNIYVARPPAALVVAALRSSGITPNQVTFLSVTVFAAAAAVMILARSWLGLLAAIGVIELSYILDCVDGQLARINKMTSPSGALLDFLMDEIKAFLLIASVAMRLRLWTGGLHWVEIGLGGLVVAATGISLTSFMRRSEYLESIGAKPGEDKPKGFGPVALVERLGQLAFHYPTWIAIPAAFDRIDLFLYVYLGAHTLYLGKASLTILVKLGRASHYQRVKKPDNEVKELS